MGSVLLGWLVFGPMVLAFPVYFLERRSRGAAQAVTLAFCIAELAAAVGLFALPGTELALPGFCGMGVSFAPGGFGRLMALVAAAGWLLALSTAPRMVRKGYVGRFRVFSLLTLGGVMGVFLCGDLFTAFVFFEIMSMASSVWVGLEGGEEARGAFRSYLTIGITGGLVMLMGLFLLYAAAGTLRLGELRAACAGVENRAMLYGAGACLLFGFGAKAGMFPLHTWLPKAYPAAPAPGTALLSAVLSKAGVFGILVIGTGLFYQDIPWGNLLLVFGLATMVLGAVYALLSDDFKRTLAGSSMSQIGFILVGAAMLSLLGEERALAAGGTVLHMLGHSVFKLILFLLAGGILAGCGTTKLSELMGYGRKKPFLLAIFLAPALGLGGVPLFAGYVSKTMLHESIVEYQHVLAGQGLSAGWYVVAEWVFLLSGGLTLAYMAKLFTVLFLEKGKGEGRAFLLSMPVKVGLGVLAVLVPLFGILPYLTYFPIADSCRAFFAAPALPKMAVFSLENLKGAGISLLAGAALYFGVVRALLLRRNPQGETVCPARWPARLSLEELLYAPAAKALAFAGALLARIAAGLGGWIWGLFARIIGRKEQVVPRTEDNFGVYTGKDYRHNIIGETLAYELLLFGIGVVATLFYLLLA